MKTRRSDSTRLIAAADPFLASSDCPWNNARKGVATKAPQPA